MRIWHYGTNLAYLLGKVVIYISILVALLQSVTYAATPDPGNFQQLIRQAETIPDLIEVKVLEEFQIPNPHWRKDACQACHVGEPDLRLSTLKSPSDGSCFYCHRVEDHIAIHPVNQAPGKKMLAQMSETFRSNLAEGGKTNCITCHDVLMQCINQTQVMRLRNWQFVRGGYYSNRTDICYQCHDKGAYKKLNPHDQISEQGVLNKDKCLICHRAVPEQDVRGGATRTALITDTDLAEICLNCHEWQAHPGGSMAIFSGGKPPNHLVVPDGKITERLAKMTQENGLEMPLEPGTGKVYCATCHNPHERGVIKKAALAKGADEKKRLRSERICINCHDK